MTPAFKKILCAVDFSDFSSSVIAAGEAMAERFGSTLMIFHSVCFPRERVSEVYDTKEARGEKETIRLAYDEIDSLMKASTVPWIPVVMEGDPADNVALTVQTDGVDMVLAASYGMSGFKRLFLGTVVERFSGLHEAPVMILRESAASEPGKPKKKFHIGRILVCCAVDPEARPLVEYGIAMAAGWDAELILVHVLEAPPAEDEAGTELISFEEAQNQVREHIRADLLNLVPPEVRGRMKVNTETLLGVPGEQVRYFIKKSDIDLAIVGGPRRGALGAFIIGSTTQYLIRHSPCSVLSAGFGRHQGA